MAGKDGHNLEQAIAILIQSQATLTKNQEAFMQNQMALLSYISETKLEMAAMRSDLEQIKAILLRHDRVLADLPEAIRQRVGFKPSR